MTDEQIFLEAIELDSTARVAYVHHACQGDPTQQTRIEKLLAAHKQSDSLLDTAENSYNVDVN